MPTPISVEDFHIICVKFIDSEKHKIKNKNKKRYCFIENRFFSLFYRIKTTGVFKTETT